MSPKEFWDLFKIQVDRLIDFMTKYLSTDSIKKFIGIEFKTYYEASVSILARFNNMLAIHIISLCDSFKNESNVFPNGNFHYGDLAITLSLLLFFIFLGCSSTKYKHRYPAKLFILAFLTYICIVGHMNITSRGLCVKFIAWYFPSEDKDNIHHWFNLIDNAYNIDCFAFSFLAAIIIICFFDTLKRIPAILIFIIIWNDYIIYKCTDDKAVVFTCYFISYIIVYNIIVSFISLISALLYSFLSALVLTSLYFVISGQFTYDNAPIDFFINDILLFKLTSIETNLFFTFVIIFGLLLTNQVLMIMKGYSSENNKRIVKTREVYVDDD